MPCALMAFSSAIIRSVRIAMTCASAASNPRSANTLPLDAVILDFLVVLRIGTFLLDQIVAPTAFFDIVFGRLLRFLLECVQDVYRLLVFDYIEHSKRARLIA